MALQRSPTDDTFDDGQAAPAKGKGVVRWLRSVVRQSPNPLPPPCGSADETQGGTHHGVPHEVSDAEPNGEQNVDPDVGPDGNTHGPTEDKPQVWFSCLGD